MQGGFAQVRSVRRIERIFPDCPERESRRLDAGGGKRLQSATDFGKVQEIVRAGNDETDK